MGPVVRPLDGGPPRAAAPRVCGPPRGGPEPLPPRDPDEDTRGGIRPREGAEGGFWESEARLRLPRVSKLHVAETRMNASPKFKR